MNEALKAELLELQNLESAGTLEDDQKPRLELLTSFEQAEKTALEKSKDLESALAQKEHFREKHEKEEAARKALEDKLNKANEGQSSTKSLEVDDFIQISASLEGLDQREKEYLAEQHKLTGQPIGDIRKGESFLMWQEGYKMKVERERALKPNDTQPDGNAVKTVSSELRRIQSSGNFRASLSEQEKLLEQSGLYKSSKPNPFKSSIG